MLRKKTPYKYLYLLSLSIIILVYFLNDSETDMVWNMPYSYNKYQETHMQTGQSDAPIDEMTILIWTPFMKKNTYSPWPHVFQRIISNQCAHRCTIIYNKTQYEMADAVFFHAAFMNVQNNYQAPPTHPVDQLWVFQSFEAKYSFKKRKEQVEKLSNVGFNWTMHFRTDADIVVPFGVIKKIVDANTTMVHTNYDIWSRKDKVKIGAWMASHCHTGSERETYVEELQKYIRVDIYGGCGKLKCGEQQMLNNRDRLNATNCTDVMNEYFFYLSFENLICRDYVTEKFFRTITLDVVPVVMGGADYKQIAPPHSYIDALDFPTPKHLADYLQKVAADPVLYNKYFEWKPYYTVDLGHPYSPMMCGLCEKLHQHRSKNSMVTTKLNLTKWFMNDDCQASWNQTIKQNTTMY